MNFIHRFVDRKSAGVVLLLHGTGGTEDDLLPLGEQIAPEWNLLSPRGKVLENGMPRFFRRLAEGVFDQADLRARTQELETFLDEAAREYGFDRDLVFAAGYSNGANMAASLMLTRPESLAGAALLRPMLPFEPDPALDLSGKPVLIAAGRQDRVIPAEGPVRLIDALRRSGAEVTEHWHSGGHELGRGDLDQTRLWFSKLGTISRR